jgi:uncharacterized membrane protein
MSSPQLPPTPGTDKPKSTFRDVEPLLKWAGVAYGAGFLTVMLHTHRLGVPVVQLIEPIYIWVGLPLAVVLYFIEQLIAAFLRSREALRNDLEEVKHDSESIKTIKDPKKAAEVLFKIIRAMWSILDLTGGFAASGVIAKALISHYEAKLSQEVAKKGGAELVTYVQKVGSRLLFVTQAFAAVYQFAARVLTLALIPAACTVYVWWLYPIIPQSLGGGRPSQVRLVLDTKKIPADDAQLRALFPAPRPDRNGERKPDQTPAESEARTTCDVALHYQTEHAYYVRRAPGPIIAVEHDAVDAVIFAPAKLPIQQDCN